MLALTPLDASDRFCVPCGAQAGGNLQNAADPVRWDARRVAEKGPSGPIGGKRPSFQTFRRCHRGCLDPVLKETCDVLPEDTTPEL